MTPVLLVVAVTAVCLVIKHAPYRWLNDRPAAPHGQAASPPPPSPKGGDATPHASRLR